MTRYEGTAKNMKEAREKAIGLIKEHIKTNGVGLPFKATNLQYGNDKIDDWFRIKEGNEILKINRTKQVMEVGV